MIDARSTLEDVCFAIAGALQAHAIDAVLTGGSAATLYAPALYTSFDADFVLRRSVQNARLAEALASIGYARSATHGMFEHAKSRFTVDFPKGPLAVGGDYVTTVATRHRGDVELRILEPTDCIKDRLAHFYHWDDETALQAAVGVARAQRSDVDVDELAQWTAREGSRGVDFRPKFETFLARAGLRLDG